MIDRKKVAFYTLGCKLNFSDWRKDRETRNSVVKIKSLIEGINAQVQRGQYAFVQVDVNEIRLVSGDDGLIVTSKGMKPKTLATLLNTEGSTWWVEPNGRCKITLPTAPVEAVDEAAEDAVVKKPYWDEDPDPNRDQIIDLDKIEVRQIVLDNVATTWRDDVGAVCFGKNDQWYSGNGELVSSSGDDVIVDSYLFICNRSNTRSQCDIDNVTGEPTTITIPLSAVVSASSVFSSLLVPSFEKRVPNPPWLILRFNTS